MNKKDLNTVAEVLKAERPGQNWDANKLVQWELIVKANAKAFCRNISEEREFMRHVVACLTFKLRNQTNG